MGASQQALFISGGVTGYLDPFGTPWGSYGLNVVVSAYAGSSIRVRRSSDDAEQDIGFVAGALDTTSLLSFVGANNGFVKTWYDQSGGANNLSQATTTKQPQIVDGGTYMSEVVWDGSDDYLVTSNSSGTPSAFTLFLGGRNRVGKANATECAVSHSAGLEWDTSFVSGTVDMYRTNLTNGTGINAVSQNIVADGVCYAYRSDRSAATIDTEMMGFAAGVAASTSVTTSGTTVTGNFTSGTWAAGSIGGSSGFSRLAATSLTIYESAISDSDIAAISALLTPSVQHDGLTSLTSNVWGIYSLRRQISSYAGSAIRVRRSSDNTESDIGFANGLLDTTSLLSFATSNSAFVVTMYDQSGNGNDIGQSTSANQPRIVNSGVVDKQIRFDGSNDYLISANNSGTPSAFTVFAKGSTLSASTIQVVIEHNSADANNSALVYVDSTTTKVGVAQSFPTNDRRMVYSTSMPGTIVAAKLDRSQATAANVSKLYSGGALLSGSVNNTAGTLSANFTAQKWSVGSRNGTTAFTGYLESIVIYETAVSDANIERISRALG